MPPTPFFYDPETKEIKYGDATLEVIVDESDNIFECSGVQVLEFSGNLERLILSKSISITPELFFMSPAYPNPFNPVTNIQITIPELSDLNVSIYNIQGQLIETLINENLHAGNHQIIWNGNLYSSGVYFVIMKSVNFFQVEKLMLIK